MNRYQVEVNGVKTTLLLSDDDAKAKGLKPVAEKSKTPANKAKTPANKDRPSTAQKRAEAAEKSFGGKPKPEAKSEG